jgi:hypothetical protein
VSTTLPGLRERARHEAAHCAAMLHMDWPPLSCRIDFPHTNGELSAGSTAPDWDGRGGLSEDGMRDFAIAVLVAFHAEGEPVTVLDGWPLEDCPRFENAGLSGDVRQLNFCGQWLSLTHVEFLQLVFKAERMWRDRRFRRLMVKVAEQLDDLELVLKPELQAIARRTP